MPIEGIPAWRRADRCAARTAGWSSRGPSSPPLKRAWSERVRQARRAPGDGRRAARRGGRRHVRGEGGRADDLTKLGCRFALDDFGAGYGSFYYLEHLPISYLKIDGEFIKALPETPVDQLIVKALVDVCRGLGIKTAAEFVGSEETMAILRQLGVD